MAENAGGATRGEGRRPRRGKRREEEEEESGKNVVVDRRPHVPSIAVANWLRPSTALPKARGEERKVLGRGRRRVGNRRFGAGPPYVRCDRTASDKSRRDAPTVAVIGNDGRLASRSGLIRSMRDQAVSGVETSDVSGARLEVMSRIRTGRAADPVTTVRLSFSDGASTCDSAVLVCQDRLRGAGVRGDASERSDSTDDLPASSRALRVHERCRALSTRATLGPVSVEGHARIADGVSNYAHRRDGSMFVGGGSSEGGEDCRALRRGPDIRDGSWTGTTSGCSCSNEEEGGSRRDKTDGVVIGDDVQRTAPLPSRRGTPRRLLPADPADRSTMGARRLTRRPAGGKAADFVPVVENVSVTSSILATPSPRASSLTRGSSGHGSPDICNEETRVLVLPRCAGAFSVAAATSGRAVSLDLDKKWLDRVRPQMESEWNHGVGRGRHDIIYGDCFDWLARLARRNGLAVDVVTFLRPLPSTSVEKKSGALKVTLGRASDSRSAAA
ncbi:LOW QUALITY PROTEIN: hypothetical protein ACHAW5_002337 [Stephanodiscus triporus]|uniref:Uncharacterized protein n=1 Tax=Stephanodiscus triporus TaxID=2934178 RepID=A0ABD3MK74_9STRA